MTKEDIKNYLKENLKLSLECKSDKYYIVLSLEDEKITEFCFGEGY